MAQRVASRLALYTRQLSAQRRPTTKLCSRGNAGTGTGTGVISFTRVLPSSSHSLLAGPGAARHRFSTTTGVDFSTVNDDEFEDMLNESTPVDKGSTRPSVSAASTTILAAIQNSRIQEKAEEPVAEPEVRLTRDELALLSREDHIKYLDQIAKEMRAAKKLRNAGPVRVPEIDDEGRSYGYGARKRAIARVWVKPGDGTYVVNKMMSSEYFRNMVCRSQLSLPFLLTNSIGKFDVWCTVRGGGKSGQSEAIRLGVARALQAYDPKYRKTLKEALFLRRDIRIVERKKVGRKKARKGHTWVKR